MVIDHIGIAVRSLEEGIDRWATLFGYTQTTSVIANTRQRTKVVFMEKEGSVAVKLIEPMDSSSPIFAFAQRGGGLHHLCFKCGRIDSELERMQAMGCRLIAGPEPGEAFDNESIAFIYARQGLNIELIDTDKRAERLRRPFEPRPDGQR